VQGSQSRSHSCLRTLGEVRSGVNRYALSSRIGMAAGLLTLPRIMPSTGHFQGVRSLRESSQRVGLQQPTVSCPTPLEHFRVRLCRQNNLVKNSTAPTLKACIRIFSSPCPVMKMIGILWCPLFSLDWSPTRRSPAYGCRQSDTRYAAVRRSSEILPLTRKPERKDQPLSSSHPVRLGSTHHHQQLQPTLVSRLWLCFLSNPHPIVQ